jgi:hypothetical protein
MAGGRIYTDIVTVGLIDIFDVTSNPNGALVGRKGSLAVLRTGATPTVFINEDGNVAWRDLSATTTPGIPVTKLVAGENLLVGDACVIEGSSGEAFKASADTTVNRRLVTAISKDAPPAGVLADFYTVRGVLIPIRFGAAPAAANNGDLCYLDTTSGLATLTAPTGPSTIVVELGVIQGADGASVTPLVIYDPQYRSQAAT